MPETPPRAVTISEIAAQAGVSVPAVSRVLNRRSDVAPRTRERVEHLLRQHGYRRRGPRADDRARLIDGQEVMIFCAQTCCRSPHPGSTSTRAGRRRQRADGSWRTVRSRASA